MKKLLFFLIALLFLIGLTYTAYPTIVELLNKSNSVAVDTPQEKVEDISKEKVVKIEPIQIADGQRSFLAISDIHLDIDADSIKPSPWGHGWTDTDKQLWEYTKAKLSEVVQQKEALKIDFMVFTGDIPFHGDDDSKRAKNIGVVLSYLSALSKEADLPLLFAPGNNDGLAGDYASFRNAEDEAPLVKHTLNSMDTPFLGNKGTCN